MAAQAIPSYAPTQAAEHFTKVECFCFSQWTLKPGESKQWPVVFVVDEGRGALHEGRVLLLQPVFVVDDKLPKDVKTITLSYTLFEVGGKVPAAPTDKPTAAVQPAGSRG